MGYALGISFDKNASSTSSVKTDNSIVDFQTCVDAGNPVMESFPPQCRANGQTFFAEVPRLSNQYPTYKGCSNVGDRVCVKAEGAKDVIISLDIKPEDECRAKYSRCEPQADGECGWTQSVALDVCLDPPRDFIPGPGEKYTIVNGKNGWRAYQEMDTQEQQWLIIESPTSTIRFISGAYPVSFFPAQDFLLIVAATQLELQGLEILDLKNATGTTRRLTNIGLPRKPGPLPSDFIPAPIDSGAWISDTVFRWTVPGDGTFQVDVVSEKVEKL
jgi:hypothetical protein